MGFGRGSWVFAGVLSCGLALAHQPAVPANGLPEGAVARLGQTRLRHAEPPTCVAFAPDAKTFVTGGQDGSVRAWSVATGELVAIAQKPAMGVAVLRFTQGGSKLAVHHGTESVIRFLDPKTLRETGTVPFVNRHRFGFSADGKLMITSNAVVTEVEGDLPKLELTGADRFDFRPDGKAVAVGDAKGNVTVHFITGGKPTFALKGLRTVHGLAYSAKVFKADRYSEDGYAQHATFSPDSRLLIFGSSGTSGRVEVWDMATRGLVRKFSTGYGGITRVCVFPDGKRPASDGAQEAVTVWDLTYRTEKTAPRADELLTAWAALDSDDAATGYPAIKLLASAGDHGTDTIARGTKDLLVTQRKIKE